MWDDNFAFVYTVAHAKDKQTSKEAFQTKAMLLWIPGSVSLSIKLLRSLSTVSLRTHSAVKKGSQEALKNLTN